MDKRYWIGLLKGVLELAFIALMCWLIEGMPSEQEFYNKFPLVIGTYAILSLNVYKERNKE